MSFVVGDRVVVAGVGSGEVARVYPRCCGRTEVRYLVRYDRGGTGRWSEDALASEAQEGAREAGSS